MNVVAIDKGIIDKRNISPILFFVFEGLYPSGVRIKKEGFIALSLDRLSNQNSRKIHAKVLYFSFFS